MVDDNKASDYTGQRQKRRNVLKVMTSAGSVGLAGCLSDGDGGGGGDTVGSPRKKSDIAGQEVHLVKGATGDKLKEVLNRVGEDFEEETGAKLNVEYAGVGEGKFKRIVSLIQAGDAPEVATPNLGLAITLRQRGALAPVTGVMERLVERHGEPTIRYRQEGEDWIVPFTQGYSDTWYRNDLLEDVGLDSGFVPDTWEKLKTYARAHNENTDEVEHGIFMPAGTAKMVGNFIMYSLYRTNNGKLTKYENEEFKAAFHKGQNKERMVETLQFMKELHQYSPDAGGATSQENEHAIPFGLSPLALDSGARVKNHSGHHDRGSEWAQSVTNVGHFPEKRSKKAGSNIGPMMVFKDAENTKAGKRFVEFLMTNPEYASAFCWGDGPVHCHPPFPGIVESEAYTSRLKNDLPDYWNTGGRGGEYTNDNGIPAAAERHLWEAKKHGQVKVMETDPPNPYMGAVLSSGKLSAMTHDVLIKDVEPEKAVNDYGKQIQRIMEREQAQN